MVWRTGFPSCLCNPGMHTRMQLPWLRDQQSAAEADSSWTQGLPFFGSGWIYNHSSIEKSRDHLLLLSLIHFSHSHSTGNWMTGVKRSKAGLSVEKPDLSTFTRTCTYMEHESGGGDWVKERVLQEGGGHENGMGWNNSIQVRECHVKTITLYCD